VRDEGKVRQAALPAHPIGRRSASSQAHPWIARPQRPAGRQRRSCGERNDVRILDYRARRPAGGHEGVRREGRPQTV